MENDISTEHGFLEAVAEAAKHSQDHVEQLLSDALTKWDSGPPWLTPPDKAEITVMLEKPTLTVMNLVWPLGMMTEPHIHNMWATIGIYQGREDNILWERSNGSIRAIGAASIGVGETMSMGAGDIHSVFNPTPGYTAAIHVYGGRFMTEPKSEWDPLNHKERPRLMGQKLSDFQAVDEK